MTRRVFVFGSINLDLVTTVKHHPVPGETVSGSDYRMLPGGKGANQALACDRWRASTDPGSFKVVMIGAVGSDGFADTALENLKVSGIDLDPVATVSSGTGLAMIAVDEHGENNIIVCPGANAFARADQFPVDQMNTGDIVLTQQETNLEEIWKFHATAQNRGALVVHNAAPAMPLDGGSAGASLEAVLGNIDYLIVNESEMESLDVELDLAGKGTEEKADLLARQYDICVILTLGAKGAAGFLNGNRIDQPAFKVSVVDSTGAGDVFCGTFAAELAMGSSAETAIRHAVKAASKACEYFGAQQRPDY